MLASEVHLGSFFLTTLLDISKQNSVGNIPCRISAANAITVMGTALCWFYDGKKNAVVKVFTYAVFLFKFYSLIDNS